MGLKNVWRSVRGTLSERSYNILVISDLHLGCELKANARREARRTPRDRQLAEFLDWYATHRTEGRPWRLILNGDVIDFVAITLTPRPGEELPFTVRAEELQYGLAPEEAKCVWKIRKVAESHGEVFDALARFLQRGNSVHIVRGNHDAEFHWPAVQEEFRRILTERAGARGAARRRLEKEIVFHAWFYLEPGFFYAEHGNAHDRYSVQTGFFEPITQAHREREMALPLSSLVMRYFVNRYAQAEDLDHADTWGVVDYLKWVFRMGNPLQIAAEYFMMVFRITYPVLRQSLRFSRKMARAAGRAVDKKLAVDDGTAQRVKSLLGRFVGASDSQVRSLVAVACRPAEQSLFDSAQLFYLDRMVLALVSLTAALAGAYLAPGLLWKATALVSVGIVFAALNAVLARQRKTDAHPLLLQAARRVSEIFDVRYVAMGHSHRAVSEPVGASARYFNTGSWTSAHLNEGFPHVCVEGRTAELRRWKGAPEAAEPALTRAPAPGAEEPAPPAAVAVPA